jgi:hypothetical protein
MSTMTEQWLALSHPDLADRVRRAVRGGSADSTLWTELGGHPVLAARVAGILSALRAQMADHRDHAMWTMWVNQARRALASGRAAATRPASSTPSSATRPAPARPAPSTATRPVQSAAARPVPSGPAVARPVLSAPPAAGKAVTVAAQAPVRPSRPRFSSAPDALSNVR